ncbi:hypothetical protein P43SY_005054 [Pythium insidiosum]|uniref:Uncharacterized protein n=1 Tax=Pythium insidiosum TaxID=114742 RepID=A0AAD5M7B1_PYTIN|nr:hypothetical protein P43SY_005054 [Pythium insidiosum]
MTLVPVHPQPLVSSARCGKQSSFRVLLSPAAFAACWLAIAALHLACIAAFLVFVLLYTTALGETMAYYCAAYAPCLSERDFPVVAVAFSALTCGHLYALGCMMSHSIRQRSLAFQARQSAHEPSSVASSTSSSRQQSRWRVSRLWSATLGRRGLCGIESLRFDYVYLTQEAIQTLFQTLQAYKLSQFEPRQRLGRLLVAVLVFNCWATPLIQRVWKGPASRPLRRCLYVSSDVLVDFLTTVVTPIAVLVPYLLALDLATMDFPDALWFDETWFVNLLLEVRLIFVSSWSDLAYRLVFGGNLLLSLDTIKSLLVRLPCSVGPSDAAITPFVSLDVPAPQTERPTARKQRCRRVLKQTVHGSLLVAGCIVLALHAIASFPSRPAHCTSVVRPWLVGHPVCILLSVDCRALGVQGLATDVDAALATIDQRRLAYLQILHCPRLQMPRSLQALGRLTGLKVYGSVLSSWPDDAGLTARTHPHLIYLALVRTNMTELPRGLLSPSFPRSVGDIEICACNLTSLPPAVGQLWADVVYFMLEETLVADFPAALLDMTAPYVSLSGNRLTSVPVEYLVSRRFMSLMFNGNPGLVALPDDERLQAPSSRPAIARLALSFTAIASLPSWIDLRAMQVVATGSPLCERPLEARTIDCEDPRRRMYDLETDDALSNRAGER